MIGYLVIFDKLLTECVGNVFRTAIGLSFIGIRKNNPREFRFWFVIRESFNYLWASLLVLTSENVFVKNVLASDWSVEFSRILRSEIFFLIVLHSGWRGPIL